MKRRAYTLPEIMTAVAIIGLISAVAVPQFATSSRRGREDALRANLEIVRSAVWTFRNDVGLFPTTLTDLLVTTPPAQGRDPSTGTLTTLDANSWRGPYLRTLPNDPVSGSALNYTATTGVVLPSATGNDSRGRAFSTY